MKSLNELRRILFKQVPSEQDTVYSLCVIMEKVGGYQNLMNMPISAVMQVNKYLEYLSKQSKKSSNKLR